MCEKCRKKAAAKKGKQQTRRGAMHRKSATAAKKASAPKASSERISSVKPDAKVKAEAKFKNKVEAGASHDFVKADGAVYTKEGHGEKFEVLHGDAKASAYAKWGKDGKGAGFKAEAGGALLRESGKHETPAIPGTTIRGYESHEVAVGTVSAKVDAGAAWTKDLKGAKIGGEVGANIVEGKVEAGTKFKIPWTDVEVTVGGGARGYVGANAHAEASAGLTKDSKGRSHFGVKTDAGAALGVGGGLFGKIDFSW